MVVNKATLLFMLEIVYVRSLMSAGSLNLRPNSLITKYVITAGAEVPEAVVAGTVMIGDVAAGVVATGDVAAGAVATIGDVTPGVVATGAAAVE
jgi:hypothetical protein